MNIKTLSTKDLVALYNKLSGKAIKKFSSRAAGEKQVAALLAKCSPASILGAEKSLQPAAVPAPVVARVVKGAASAEAVGRPKANFDVTLTAAAAISKPNSLSLRRQLITDLAAAKGQTISIAAIESKFGRNMRGVVQKLRDKHWVTTTQAA